MEVVTFIFFVLHGVPGGNQQGKRMRTRCLQEYAFLPLMVYDNGSS